MPKKFQRTVRLLILPVARPMMPVRSPWWAAVRRAVFRSSVILCGWMLITAALAAPAEEQAYAQAAAAMQRMAKAITPTSRAWCPPDVPSCRLDLYLGIPNAIEVFYADKAIWLSVQTVQMTRNDAELALLIGHEWAHLLLGHRGFDDGRELIADCVGALAAWRSGYDPGEGVALYARLASYPNLNDVMAGLLGIGASAAKPDWNRRIAAVRHARAQAAGKPITPADVARICGVTF